MVLFVRIGSAIDGAPQRIPAGARGSMESAINPPGAIQKRTSVTQI